MLIIFFFQDATSFRHTYFPRTEERRKKCSFIGLRSDDFQAEKAIRLHVYRRLNLLHETAFEVCSLMRCVLLHATVGAYVGIDSSAWYKT